MATDITVMLLEQDEIIQNEIYKNNELFESESTYYNVKTVDGLKLSWSRSLAYLPVFTIKEIEKHRQLSGKLREKNEGLLISITSG